MAQVEFFFSLGCPWTYLAFTRLREAAMRAGGVIVWKPVLSERISRATGEEPAGRDFGAGPRGRYLAKDLEDWARFCGVSISRPPPYPVAAGWAARGAIAALEAGAVARYCESVFAACFSGGANPNELTDVVQIAARSGLDSDGFRRNCMSSEAEKAVEGFSDELVERGGFCSPTMFIGNDMYVGNDRMPLVELALSMAAEHPLIVPGAHGQRS